MRILVVSTTPWHSTNSFGNSFSNIFEGVADIEVASVSCSSVRQVDGIVSACFEISERSLLENLKNKSQPSGRPVTLEVPVSASLAVSPCGNSLMTFAKKKRWMMLFWARDLIWKVGRWKSPELLQFVRDFKPDLVFQPIYFSSYPDKIGMFLQEYARVPMVGYISDDNYTLRRFSFSPMFWIDRLCKRRTVKKTILRCELLYVISELQKQEYEKIFDIPCKILTKCADFSGEPPVKTKYNDPLQLVFTGNIGTNRWKTLARIAQALQIINRDGVRAQLRIYTATPVTHKMREELDVDGSSFLMGSVPASEIPRIQSDADMLVHVEALDLKNRLAVRQSFSTKLVDYFKAARPILAVGPHDVASIAHLIENDCALVAETVEQIEAALEAVLADSGKLNDFSENAYACGRAHHDKAVMQQMLQADLNRVIKEGWA